MILSLSLIMLSLTYQVESCENIKSTVESASLGDTVVIDAGHCVADYWVNVPSGVTVTGAPGARIDVDHYPLTSAKPLFFVSNTEDVTIKNLEIHLGYNAQAVRVWSWATPAKNLTIKNLQIFGNRHEEDTCYIALYLPASENATIEGNTIIDGFGGIYLHQGLNNLIVGNRILRTSFGNIVVGGSNVRVYNNVVEESGLPGTLRDLNGDAITISGGSDNIIITGNILRGWQGGDGCYLIWAPLGASNVFIARNTFAHGITAGVQLISVDGVTVVQNTFYLNAAAGLDLRSCTDVVEEGNVYARDEMVVYP